MFPITDFGSYGSLPILEYDPYICLVWCVQAGASVVNMYRLDADTGTARTVPVASAVGGKL